MGSNIDAGREAELALRRASDALGGIHGVLGEIANDLSERGFVRTDGLNSPCRSLAHYVAEMSEALAQHYTALRIGGIDPKSEA